MIVGLTGTFSSGKDTVAEYLVTKGLVHVSTSDLIREEARRRGLGLERESLQSLGTQLRTEYGVGYLAELAIAKYPDNVVVSGLRNLGEIATLRKLGFKGSVIIAVDAPIEKRYEWAKTRGRIDDSVSFDKFREMENFEYGENPTGIQLGKVIKSADFLIVNNGSLKELYGRVDQAMAMWFPVHN